MVGHTPRAQVFEGRCSYCEKDIIDNNKAWKCVEKRKTFIYKVRCRTRLTPWILKLNGVTSPTAALYHTMTGLIGKLSMLNNGIDLSPMKMQNSASEYKTNREFSLRVWC